MNFLSFIPLFLAQTQSDSISWYVSENWSPSMELTTAYSWDLNAPGPGTYRLWGCSTSPIPELTLDMRWRQDLAGSNNNQSRFFISESPPSYYSEDESLPEESLIFSIGRNGSDDPLVITTPPSSSSQEINSEYFDFSEPFDLDFSVRLNIDSSTLSLRASHHNSDLSLPILETSLTSSIVNFSPKCFGFEATCTSSNTDAFSWAVNQLQDFWAPLPTYKIISQSALDSISIEIFWNRLPPSGITVFPSSVSLPHQTSSPNSSFHSQLPQMVDGIPNRFRVTASEIDTTINLVLTNPNEIEFRELTITEVFVDATPSIGLPEVEWIEVLNTSARVIDIEGCGFSFESGVSDSGQAQSITPYNSWDGLISPYERFLICTSPYPSTNNIFDQGYFALASGFSNLSDNGMTLTILRPDGTLIDQISYNRTWWHEESLSARSTNIIHPGGCGLPENWRPSYSSFGATPWQPSFLEGPASMSYVPLEITPHQRTSHKVVFVIQPCIDPLSNIQARLSHEDEATELIFENPYWVMNRISPLPRGKPLHIILEGAKLCSNGQNVNGEVHDWIPTLPPKWGDLVISEFLTNPAPDSPWGEWIEIVNISGRTIDLEGLQLNSGYLLSSNILEADSFLILSPENLSVWSSLSRNSGTLTLSMDDHFIDIVNYSKCFHDDSEKADGGFSLERVNFHAKSNDPQNWVSGVGFFGGSPGKEREHSNEATMPVITRDTSLVWGDYNGKLVWQSPFSMDSCVLQSTNWMPQIEWDFFENETNIAVSRLSIIELFDLYENENQILTLDCTAWKTISRSSSSRVNSWTIERPDESSSLNFHLNELLSNPDIGGSKFIEIGNLRNFVSSTSGVLFSSDENPVPNDWSAFTNINWWVPSNGLLAVAECPNWVKNLDERSVIVKGDIPSLAKGRLLQLASSINTEVDSLRITNSEEGVSKSRLDLSKDIWVNTPLIEGGSSPGRLNYSSLNAFNSEKKETALTISPKTIDLNSISYHRWAQIEWAPPKDSGIWSIKLKIYTQEGTCISTLSDDDEIESLGVWIFEGRDNEGRAVYPGTYIVVLEADNIVSNNEFDAEKKVVRRGLIQVTAM
ncbi:MAG: hypothetical protein COA49_08905 [Bacteroidetes bacterium]|nr:MAG: hypothetical protein COA49_08905 [Bacteroidota bacterium]